MRTRVVAKPAMSAKCVGTKAVVNLLGVLSALLFSPNPAVAQKYEIAFSLGAMTAGDRDFKLPGPGAVRIGTGLTYQANYAQWLVNAKAAALYFEVPLAATPNTKIKSSSLFSPRDYASLFITPGLKLKLLPAGPYSPYMFAGIGYARFSESDARVDGRPNTSRGTNRVAFDFGGGLDVKIFPYLSVRGELRDYVSGNPRFNVDVLGNRQHNVLLSGGLVLRFR
ncbi:MAG TPA: hypothetical protein VJH03_11525 [Blastocatellia bacterium]|nr:hypothetical protein [Blastocatellia bacterium]